MSKTQCLICIFSYNFYFAEFVFKVLFAKTPINIIMELSRYVQSKNTLK